MLGEDWYKWGDWDIDSTEPPEGAPEHGWLMGCHTKSMACVQKVNGLTCDPGMKGCVLYGRYVFASPGKNERILVQTGAKRCRRRIGPKRSTMTVMNNDPVDCGTSTG